MKILIITCLIILAFELFLLWLFRRKGIKGRVGELFIAFFLKRKLDKEQYHILNDVMLPDQNGGTTQIDHVIFSRFGIFVVETKNWQGNVFGALNDKKWTLKFYSRKYQVENPFNQNYKHICCLSEITGLPQDRFVSMVALLGLGSIKTPEKLPPSCVPGIASLIRYIKSYTVEIISDENLAAAENAVRSARLKNSIKNVSEHKKYVQNIIKNQNTCPKSPVVDAEKTSAEAIPPLSPETDKPEMPDPPRLCPICGSVMVERVSGKGKNPGQVFWGCSKFPRCTGRRFK